MLSKTHLALFKTLKSFNVFGQGASSKGSITAMGQMLLEVLFFLIPLVADTDLKNSLYNDFWFG